MWFKEFFELSKGNKNAWIILSIQLIVTCVCYVIAIFFMDKTFDFMKNFDSNLTASWLAMIIAFLICLIVSIYNSNRLLKVIAEKKLKDGYS